MKRRVGLILLLLVAGAMVNVAVAWGSALLIGYANNNPSAHACRATSELVYVADAYDPRLASFRVGWYQSRRVKSLLELGPEPHTLLPSWLGSAAPLADENLTEMWHVEARGWPLLSMWSQTFKLVQTRDGVQTTLPPEGGVALSLPPFEGMTGPMRRVLPLRILWLNSALNTLFYAASFWLLFAAPFALRRRRRIKRGLCPKCAYPVGDSAVCTECGRPHKVTPKAA